MNDVKLKDVLTEEEQDHIQILRIEMSQSRSFLYTISAWRKIKKILKLAEDRYKIKKFKNMKKSTNTIH